jgi:hypothetical protein
MTFREAYKRTGRILNVSCVPSDPHSPAILANYLTSPDCVIWSAVLASAAVPGVLNPVVLMKKTKYGRLEPYSFGQWKDGSLRTDIPLKALNLHFNVNFSIVSQVNPHINLFFFSSRGTVGRPVTHRKGRGWRGGFLGSAAEQYLKLDLNKWLKVLRHLELLPRPLGQDWSQLWLQRFSGTVTIWPKSEPWDFLRILSDPTPERLARMIRVGQMSTWPKLKFIANRARLERLIVQGRRASRPTAAAAAAAVSGAAGDLFSDDDIQRLLARNSRRHRGEKQAVVASDADDNDVPASAAKPVDAPPVSVPMPSPPTPLAIAAQPAVNADAALANGSPSLGSRLRHFFGRRRGAAASTPPRLDRAKSASTASSASSTSLASAAQQRPQLEEPQSPRPLERQSSSGFFGSQHGRSRRGSVLREVARQTSVFFEDADFDAASASGSDGGPLEHSAATATTAGGQSADSMVDGGAAQVNSMHDSEDDDLMLKAVGPTIIG